MRWKIAAIGIIFTILSVIVLTERSNAQDTVSIDLFYQELSPYGEWSPHIEFGYIWQPYDVGPYWKPYTEGRWAWSDQGWIWISYEPWGWATYHYGRWVFDDYQGWIWIPGTTWAPAWVSWQQSPEYIGWSPLPPDRGFFIEIGFVFNSYNDYYYKPYRHKRHHKKHRYYHDYYYDQHNYRPPARHSVFLPTNSFGHHKHAGKAAIPDPQYTVVLRNSKNVTNIKYVNNKVINYGPDKHYIEKRSNRKLESHKIVDRKNVQFRGQNNVNNVKGNSYNVYRPKIQRANKDPFIKNRNPNIKNSSRNPNSTNSISHNQRQFNKQSQNTNFNPKSNNQSRKPELSIKAGSSKNNVSRSNSSANTEKVYRQNQQRNNSKKGYNSQSNGYNKYSYKNRDQGDSKPKQPSSNMRTRSVQGNKASSKKQNFNNARSTGNKNTQRSNNYGKPQYGKNNKSVNKSNYKSIKKSNNKNYSSSYKKASGNKAKISQSYSYKPKTSTMPSSTKATFSKR